MKATFNGTCDTCGGFKPRCTKVYPRTGFNVARPDADLGIMILCPSCRKSHRVMYRLHEQHKEKQK